MALHGALYTRWLVGVGAEVPPAAWQKTPIYEDNDAVNKMIIKGRSPSMRHISRTHRVNLECLFDQINLYLGIQNTNVNTCKQIAETLTRGSFTRERWTQLTNLFNLMTPHVHYGSRSLVFSFVQKDDKMSQRVLQNQSQKAARQRPVRNFGA